jgi:tRNA threonylcarbamoyladenosine biosynthesis protein TsaE
METAAATPAGPYGEDHLFTLTVVTASVEETRRVGKAVGEKIACGMVVALTGGLGSGKTTFVQGLAIGLQVSPEYYITSPTFTLINEYPGRCRLYHVDLYRIAEAEEIEEIGLSEILRGNGVAAIEWAERIENDLPQHHLHVFFDDTNEDSRKLRLCARGSEAASLLKKLALSIEE